MKTPCARERANRAQAAFTIVEAIVALTIIAIGTASMVMGMSQLNKEASISRNATGAGAILQNQIDTMLSNGPFNPQKTNEDGSAQIPKASDGTYDMTVGTHTVAYKDPTTGVISTLQDPWPVYRVAARWTYATAAARTGASGLSGNDIGQLAFQSDAQTYWRLTTTAPTWTQDTTDGIIVRGTLTSTVTNISTSSLPNTYMAVFTLGYQYQGRGSKWNSTRNRWEYQLSMSTIRTSDI